MLKNLLFLQSKFDDFNIANDSDSFVIMIIMSYLN
jgi:hypothetical protein